MNTCPVQLLSFWFWCNVQTAIMLTKTCNRKSLMRICWPNSVGTHTHIYIYFLVKNNGEFADFACTFLHLFLFWLFFFLFPVLLLPCHYEMKKWILKIVSIFLFRRYFVCTTQIVSQNAVGCAVSFHLRFEKHFYSYYACFMPISKVTTFFHKRIKLLDTIHEECVIVFKGPVNSFRSLSVGKRFKVNRIGKSKIIQKNIYISYI